VYAVDSIVKAELNIVAKQSIHINLFIPNGQVILDSFASLAEHFSYITGVFHVIFCPNFVYCCIKRGIITV